VFFSHSARLVVISESTKSAGMNHLDFFKWSELQNPERWIAQKMIYQPL
jgi:hypothetical protein